MDYITRADALQILKNMNMFEVGLKSFFARFEYNLHENLGRRNILLSNAQEKETQKVLSKKYKSVISDGSPGKPDVVIEDIDVELECKLTSGSRSNGTITYNLQTDWETICNKGKLDYNYIIASEDFSEFCYIIFEGLTPDDFHPPSTGARGKARMRKETAYSKATFLVGSMTDNAKVRVENIKNSIADRLLEKESRLAELAIRLEQIVNKETKKYAKVLKTIENESLRHDKAIKKLLLKQTHWENNCSYTFNLESIFEKKAESFVNPVYKVYNILKQGLFDDTKFFSNKNKQEIS